MPRSAAPLVSGRGRAPPRRRPTRRRAASTRSTRCRGEHQFDAVERRPVAGVLAMALGERVPAVAQMVGRRSRRRRRRRWRSAAHARHYGTRRHGRRRDLRRRRSRRAAAAGRGVVKHTPVTTSAALSDRVGGTVVLKAENLQRTGSFKIRGAMNKLAALGDRARGGRHRRERRQPRPGAGLRRSPRRRAVRDLRARRRADLQDRGVPRLRRDGRSRAATRSTRRCSRARERAAERRHGVLPPVRRPRRRRRPGDARAASCSATSPICAA